LRKTRAEYWECLTEAMQRKNNPAAAKANNPLPKKIE
jgi:hypothetical protein